MEIIEQCITVQLTRAELECLNQALGYLNLYSRHKDAPLIGYGVSLRQEVESLHSTIIAKIGAPKL